MALAVASCMRRGATRNDVVPLVAPDVGCQLPPDELSRVVGLGGVLRWNRDWVNSLGGARLIALEQGARGQAGQPRP